MALCCSKPYAVMTDLKIINDSESENFLNIIATYRDLPYALVLGLFGCAVGFAGAWTCWLWIVWRRRWADCFDSIPPPSSYLPQRRAIGFRDWWYIAVKFGIIVSRK